MDTLLFVDYWSFGEPLTQATVLPTLRMVIAEGLVRRAVLVTVERGAGPATGPVPDGVLHLPLRASTARPRPLARLLDMIQIPGRVARIAREQQASFIMARGVVAGGIAHRAHRRTGIPYAVDYFEPHADYMVDVGEWRRGGALDRGLRRLINDQLGAASALITVSNNYRNQLMAAGHRGDRLLVAPCPVDAARMRFDPLARQAVREEMGWGDAVIGIYAGKFGGLYHREQAYRTFAEAQRVIGGRFALVVLTPASEAGTVAGLRAAGFTGDRLLVRYAPHAEVPRYLSTADLAFAPYRGTPSSACISPMKIGEYWASGLPVILTRGVGDDSAIIDADPFAGALYDPEGDDLPAALQRVMDVLQRPDQRSVTALLADRHRSMELTRRAYQTVLSAASR